MDQRPDADALAAARLTEAEFRILPLLLEDRSLSEVAAAAGLPRSVVEALASSIFRKLGVRRPA